LKQVEDETKIRADYLHAFESNEFDFDLPVIYRRGFLRTYAQFLGLDPSKFVAKIHGEDGHVSDIVVVEHGEDPVDDDSGCATCLKFSGISQKLSDAWKFVLTKSKSRRVQVGAGVIIFVVTLGYLLWPSPKKNSLEWEELLNGVASEVVSVAANPVKKITLVATEPVQVLVRSKDTLKKIFSGTVHASESASFECDSDVQISFSDGNALCIRRDDGSVVKPKKQGAGWMELAY
jgi:hypothetical protein